MPRPIPEYVPPVIAHIILVRFGDLQTFAKKVRIKKTTLYHFYNLSEHSVLMNFRRLCHALNTTIDDGANVLAAKKSDSHNLAWDKLIRDAYGTYKACADDLRISPNYLTDLVRGGVGKKILTQYKPQADTLGWTLEEFATILGDAKK